MEEIQQEKLQLHVDDDDRLAWWWMLIEVQNMSKQEMDDFMKQLDEEMDQVMEILLKINQGELKMDEELLKQVKAQTARYCEISELCRQQRQLEIQKRLDENWRVVASMMDEDEEEDERWQKEMLEQLSVEWDLLQQDQEKKHQQKERHLEMKNGDDEFLCSLMNLMEEDEEVKDEEEDEEEDEEVKDEEEDEEVKDEEEDERWQKEMLLLKEQQSAEWDLLQQDQEKKHQQKESFHVLASLTDWFFGWGRNGDSASKVLWNKTKLD